MKQVVDSHTRRDTLRAALADLTRALDAGDVSALDGKLTYQVPGPPENRRERLAELVGRERPAGTDESAHDPAVDEALETGKVPRYALVTSEGSPESTYRDNPNVTLHKTLDELSEAAAGEYAEGWCALEILDLETGAELGWRVKVEVE